MVPPWGLHFTHSSGQMVTSRLSWLFAYYPLCETLFQTKSSIVVSGPSILKKQLRFVVCCTFSDPVDHIIITWNPFRLSISFCKLRCRFEASNMIMLTRQCYILPAKHANDIEIIIKMVIFKPDDFKVYIEEPGLRPSDCWAWFGSASRDRLGYSKILQQDSNKV